MRVGPDPGGGFVMVAGLEELGDLDGLAGIKNVQVANATAELDDLATECLDRFDVLALQVPQNEWVDALGGEP